MIIIEKRLIIMNATITGQRHVKSTANNENYKFFTEMKSMVKGDQPSLVSI